MQQFLSPPTSQQSSVEPMCTNHGYPIQTISFWEVVVVEVVGGKEGGVGETEDVMAVLPPGQPPPGAWSPIQAPGSIRSSVRWDTV